MPTDYRYSPHVNINEARKMLGDENRGRIYELIESGDIATHKEGSRVLVVTASVLAYVKAQEVQEEEDN